MYMLIAITSLVIFGVYASLQEGMILSRLRAAMERGTDNNLLRWIRPALYECVVCMASVWGTAVWMMDGRSLSFGYPVFIFAVAGLNYVILNLFNE